MSNVDLRSETVGSSAAAVPLYQRVRMDLGTHQTGAVEFGSSLPYLIWLFSIGSYFVYRYATLRSLSLDHTSLWLVLCVAVAHLMRAIILKRDPLSPDVIFTVFFGMFHFAGHFADYFGFAYRRQFFVPFLDLLNPAFLYSSAFLVFFLFGYELRSVVRRRAATYAMTPTSPLAVNLAQAIFFLSVALMLIDVVRSGGRVLSVQYENAMYTEGQDLFRLWAVGKQLSLVSIFVYVAASIHARARLFQNRLFLSLVIVYVGILFMSGKRGTFLVAALPPLFLYHHFITRIRLRWILILTLVLIPTFPALKYMRTDGGGYSLSRLAEGFEKTESPFLETLAEAGGTYRVVNAGMHYAETDGFFHGRSYVAAIAKTVPYLGGWIYGRYTWSAPGLWLTLRHQGGGAGMGGSVAMESFVNFGVMGLLVAVALGLGYRILYERALLSPSLLKTFLFCAASVLLIRLVRGDFSDLVRPLLWGGTLVAILGAVTGKWSARRG